MDFLERDTAGVGPHRGSGGIKLTSRSSELLQVYSLHAQNLEVSLKLSVRSHPTHSPAHTGTQHKDYLVRDMLA
jgi:hypothetical protein